MKNATWSSEILANIIFHRTRLVPDFFHFFPRHTIKGYQVSRQVQTEMRKTKKKEASGFARSEKGPERARVEGEADQNSAALPPVIRGLQEANPDHAREEHHAELKMRLGVESKENGRSRTKPLAKHRATLARTPEGTRDSSEPVTCGERWGRMSMPYLFSSIRHARSDMAFFKSAFSLLISEANSRPSEDTEDDKDTRCIDFESKRDIVFGDSSKHHFSPKRLQHTIVQGEKHK